MNGFAQIALIISIMNSQSQSFAQQLPPPSRTIFKCENSGKVMYSDSPCIGAKRLEIQPTRGVNQLTGIKQIGNDVAQEQYREAIATALRPLTGMDANQLNHAGRRNNLKPEIKRICKILDQEIPSLEHQERSLSGEKLSILQRDLLIKRLSFKNNGCE